MGDFPEPIVMPSPAAITCLAAQPELLHWDTLNASRAWPLTNKGIFIPFSVERAVTAYQMSVQPGNTPTGNVDCGIYDLSGNRIVSSGAVAMTISTLAADFTDTLLKPGWYFMAAACDGTQNLSAGTPNVNILASFGVCEMASAYPLPATATLTRATSSYLPSLSVHLKSVS